MFVQPSLEEREQTPDNNAQFQLTATRITTCEGVTSRKFIGLAESKWPVEMYAGFEDKSGKFEIVKANASADLTQTFLDA